MAKAYCFTAVLIDSQKLLSFSTLNDLQYTVVMYHLVIGYKPTYVTNIIGKTLNPQTRLHHIHPLGYNTILKWCIVEWSYLPRLLPKWSSPKNGIQECTLLKNKRDDWHTSNTILPSNAEECLPNNIKACKWMRHVVMRNGECIWKLYTLHEGVAI